MWKYVHKCIKKLLSMGDDGSLKCLCHLLMTVGKKLDVDTKKRLPQNGLTDLSVYLNKLKKIKEDKDNRSKTFSV